MFKKSFSKLYTGQSVYVDHASITPVSKKVIKSMKPFLMENFFNPSAIYKKGVSNKKVIESCREDISKILKVRSEDIFFTSSGTESNNLFLLGLFRFAKEKLKIKKPHFIISTIEHPSIFEVCNYIESCGGEVTRIDVSEKGVVNVDDVLKELKETTVGISIMYANNEIGTIQPIKNIGRFVKKWKQDNARKHGDMPYIHTDASQASGYLDIDCERLQIHAMTIDGTKIYGPRGTSILYKSHFVELLPIIFGGGQEMGLRSGTENVAGIVGIKTALLEMQKNKEKISEKLKTLREYMSIELKKTFPTLTINGEESERLPHILNFCISGLNSEYAVIQLDERGIMCSSMTACKNLQDESASFVIKAIGKPECAESSLRISFGLSNTLKDAEYIVNMVKEVVLEQNISI